MTRNKPDLSPADDLVIAACPDPCRDSHGVAMCACPATCEAQIRAAGMWLAEYPALEISIHAARIRATQYARERRIRLQHITERAVHTAALRAGRAAPGGRYITATSTINEK